MQSTFQETWFVVSFDQGSFDDNYIICIHHGYITGTWAFAPVSVKNIAKLLPKSSENKKLKTIKQNPTEPFLHLIGYSIPYNLYEYYDE